VSERFKPDPSSASLPFRNGGPAQEERLSGVVERVTFYSEESGFCVLRVKVRGRRELATVVGRAASVAAGEYVRAVGRWGRDPRHGPQFRASELSIEPPTTRDGVERFLGSGLIRGIGPELAQRLVEAFGDEVFQVIEQSPSRLSEVPGIGDVRRQRLVEAWADQKHVRGIMVFLHSHGVGTARAVRIYQTYGAEAVDKIRENPYRLARDIRGIGFATADELAAQLGVAKTAQTRLRAGIRHVLGEALSNGNCGLPEEELLGLSEGLLEAPRDGLEEALRLEVDDRALVRDSVRGRSCVFLAGLYFAERSAARRLLALAAGRPPWPEIDVGRALPWVEAKIGLSLAASQRDALGAALASKLLIVTGGPGVGKTTLVNALLEILTAKGVRTALAAPTGRAAKRLGEATGLAAMTLHRLLEADPSTGDFRRSERNPLDCDLLVVDESSMIDVPLLHGLLRAVPLRAALLLIGDVDQLPSVGPGQVLADAIASGSLGVVRLHEVFRQAARSRIVRAAHCINQGRMPELDPDPDADFFFVEVDEPENAAELLLRAVRERIPQRFGLDPIRDVQVLCPMHRGRLGVRSLNLELQAALNPPERAAARIERFGWIFVSGDKVMQVENNYEKGVYNGDVGVVCHLDSDARELAVDIDGRVVTYDFEELDQLVLAYAISIHKAQGSEYPAVVIPLVTQHYMMLRRNLVYTGITRGRQLVVVIGQRRAMAIAVKGAHSERRWSRLGEWLTAEQAAPPIGSSGS
jgi:exodeoxyribonuclease V alpha subunit